MTDHSIELRDVGVEYPLIHRMPRKLKGVPALLRPSKNRVEPHWALRSVSASVRPGEIVGVVGANGAGKSTLLRLLAAVFRPTTGRVIVRGDVAPIIDLGAGLDLGATGRENVITYGSLLGRSPRELEREADAILEWAELEDYADVPVFAYSGGMLARLVFATATARAPDVLLIDEVLAVGDVGFQARSAERIAAIVDAGCTVVVVSHDPGQLRRLTQRALWLDGGRLTLDGDTDSVLDAYISAAGQAA